MIVVQQLIWILKEKSLCAIHAIGNRRLFSKRALYEYTTIVATESTKRVWIADKSGSIVVYKYDNQNEIKREDRLFVVPLFLSLYQYVKTSKTK